MHPILFNPEYKELVWGGTKLKTLFNKAIPYTHTGESWEIASHKHGQSIVRNGPYSGLTLKELLEQHGDEIVGKTYGPHDLFPLLVKLIDATADLSVQVHPNDMYAALHEGGGLGKSEAWIVLDATLGSRLVVGLTDHVTKEDFKQAIKDGNVEKYLNQVEVQPGDVIHIPAGLLHAIGSGIMLAEIQQNSDTTYRVFDWNRVGLDGKSRTLHIDQSLDVIDFNHNFSTSPVNGDTVSFNGYDHTCYIINQYFTIETIQVSASYQSLRVEDFELFMVLDGNGVIQGDFETLSICKGDSLMIPKSLNMYQFVGTMNLLKTYVPSSIDQTVNRLTQLGFNGHALVKK